MLKLFCNGVLTVLYGTVATELQMTVIAFYFNGVLTDCRNSVGTGCFNGVLMDRYDGFVTVLKRTVVTLL